MIEARRLLGLCVLLVPAVASATAAADGEAASVVALAERYCIQPDGDHRLTWTLAERDGFTVMRPEDFARANPTAIHDDTLRGFSKVIDGHEIRVLTAASWLSRPDQGRAYFRWCWVSSTQGDGRQVNRELGDLLSNAGFQMDRVRMFAWIPRPDGSLESVSRRDFMRKGNDLAREQGMRQAITRAYDGGVFVGYASPRDEATYRNFDWGGPEPVPAPAR